MSDKQFAELEAKIGVERRDELIRDIVGFLNHDDEAAFLAWREALPELERSWLHQHAKRGPTARARAARSAAKRRATLAARGN